MAIRERLGRRQPYPAIFISPAITSFLTAGTIAFTNSGPAGILLTETAAATGGSGGITRQWQRGTDGVTFGTNLGTGSTQTDSTAVIGTLYYYRARYTDGASNVTYSNTQSAQVYTGGSLTGGGVSATRLKIGM
jgi:hypothetical protein